MSSDPAKRPPTIVDAANLLLKYAAIRCSGCGHRSSDHSDIGTCERCACMCFEEPAEELR